MGQTSTTAENKYHIPLEPATTRQRAAKTKKEIPDSVLMTPPDNYIQESAHMPIEQRSTLNNLPPIENWTVCFSDLG